MKYPPRDYQLEGARLIQEALRSPGSKKTAGFVAPCGSGKSSVHALCQLALPELYITAPNGLILAGIYEMLTGVSKYESRESDWTSARLFTDKKLLNLLAKGHTPPRFLLHDEGAHCTSDTHSAIWDLCGRCPRALLTATPYRGTPDETEKLRTLCDSWTHVLTLQEALTREVVTLPEFHTQGLLDDELIDITNGEFSVKSTESLVSSRLEALVEFIGRFYKEGLWEAEATLVLPGVASVNLLRDALATAGLPAVSIIAETSAAERLASFDAAMARTHLLLQIRAVGEGVDFHFRLMFDAAPTTSPMLWFQRLGRTTRPGGRSRYFSLCHNLLRHAYLFEGLIPTGQINQARTAWGKEWKPSRRIMARALGMDGLGRFKPVEIGTASGGSVFLYAIKSALDSYAALLIPNQPEPLFFHRSDTPTGEIGDLYKGGRHVQYMKKAKGKWELVTKLPHISNASSLPPDRVSDRLLFEWATSATRYGLDAGVTPDAKQAVLFHILRDIGLGVP